jgi:uncharacterized membrane protein YidH (DUF202 family)
MDGSQFITKLAQEIINPIILLLVGFALIVFLWGVVEYIRGADSSGARETGREHMIWGIIGLFIMVAAYTILKILTKTIFS